jgi:two-component system, sensor histidine kinase RegB
VTQPAAERQGTLLAMDRRDDAFRSLTRLRWVAIAGQTVTLLVCQLYLGIDLPWIALGAVIGVELVLNLVARDWKRPVTPDLVTAALAADVVLLTTLLFLTGGPHNPFSALVLVYVVLATLLLPPRRAWMVAALAVAGAGVLFQWNLPLRWGRIGHLEEMRYHLVGMWIALGVTAAQIVWFVASIQREVGELRARTARQARLEGLATLAAGAAHELSTPLGTIAVAARELTRTLAEHPAREDAELIREQVARCREILESMAGGSRGEAFREVELGGLLTALAEGSPVEVDATPATARLPEQAVRQALRGLLKNAREAGGARPVSVRSRVEGERWVVEIVDHGPGMEPEVLDRVGEPFFSTKAPGAGMGLGVYLGRAVAEQLGGRVQIVSRPGVGTTVRWEVPV